MKCDLTEKETCNTTNYKGLGLMISIHHIIREFDSREEFLNALYKKLRGNLKNEG